MGGSLFDILNLLRDQFQGLQDPELSGISPFTPDNPLGSLGSLIQSSGGQFDPFQTINILQGLDPNSGANLSSGGQTAFNNLLPEQLQNFDLGSLLQQQQEQSFSATSPLKDPLGQLGQFDQGPLNEGTVTDTSTPIEKVDILENQPIDPNLTAHQTGPVATSNDPFGGVDLNALNEQLYAQQFPFLGGSISLAKPNDPGAIQFLQDPSLWLQSPNPTFFQQFGHLTPNQSTNGLTGSGGTGAQPAPNPFGGQGGGFDPNFDPNASGGSGGDRGEDDVNTPPGGITPPPNNTPISPVFPLDPTGGGGDTGGQNGLLQGQNFFGINPDFNPGVLNQQFTGTGLPGLGGVPGSILSPNQFGGAFANFFNTDRESVNKIFQDLQNEPFAGPQLAGQLMANAFPPALAQALGLRTLEGVTNPAAQAFGFAPFGDQATGFVNNLANVLMDPKLNFLHGLNQPRLDQLDRLQGFTVVDATDENGNPILDDQGNPVRTSVPIQTNSQNLLQNVNTAASGLQGEGPFQGELGQLLAGLGQQNNVSGTILDTLMGIFPSGNREGGGTIQDVIRMVTDPGSSPFAGEQGQAIQQLLSGSQFGGDELSGLISGLAGGQPDPFSLTEEEVNARTDLLSRPIERARELAQRDIKEQAAARGFFSSDAPAQERFARLDEETARQFADLSDQLVLEEIGRRQAGAQFGLDRGGLLANTVLDVRGQEQQGAQGAGDIIGGAQARDIQGQGIAGSLAGDLARMQSGELQNLGNLFTQGALSDQGDAFRRLGLTGDVLSQERGLDLQRRSTLADALLQGSLGGAQIRAGEEAQLTDAANRMADQRIQQIMQARQIFPDFLSEERSRVSDQALDILNMANQGLFGAAGTIAPLSTEAMRANAILEAQKTGNFDALGQLLAGAGGAAAGAAQIIPIIASIFSDRNIKKDFKPANTNEILEKVKSLPIEKWSYKFENGTTHIGPMAQDFKAAFEVGETDKLISFIDANGVALAAIQALSHQVEALKEEVNRLKNGS